MPTPKRIGRYRIERELGRGGMGVVYAGYDDQLQRPVAIKVIADEHASENQRRRFLREARSAARMHHPNVCHLYEISEQEDEPFIAMELLDGESLAARLARGPMPVAEAVAVAEEILSALSALHDQKTVHRDLKPSNVFLTPHGVKVLDFGLARQIPSATVESEGATESQLTQAGALLGTPSYMAPEQLRSQQVDARADLFALAAVLFEMVTATRAFAGETHLEIYHRTLHEQPLALSGSEALRELDKVIRCALAKKPEDRFPSARAMLKALQAVKATEDPGEQVRTHALTRLIVLPFRLLRSDPETDFLGFAVPDAIASALGRLDSLVVRSTASATRLLSEDVDLKRIAAEADVDVVVVGSLVRLGDRLRFPVQLVEAREGAVLWSQQLDVTMRDLFQLQDEIVERIVESLSLSLTATESRRLRSDVPTSPTAYEFFLRGNQRMEPGLVDRDGLLVARDLYRQCIEEDPRYAPAWVRIGRCHFLLARGGEDPVGNVADAESCLERALELNADLPEAHHAYALVEIDRGRARAAMVRLVRLASESSAEPQLYKALEQACRSCGLLEASIASHEKARALDAHILTSAYVSQWYLGHDDAALAALPPHPAYADAIIHGARGQTEVTLRLLRQRESGRLPPLVRNLLASLRLLFEGKREESLDKAERCFDEIAHAEFAFLACRHLAYFHEYERCVEVLGQVLEHGFNPFRQLVRDDPWLAGLRGTKGYPELVERARGAYDEAVVSFDAVGGERLLGIRVPRGNQVESYMG